MATSMDLIKKRMQAHARRAEAIARSKAPSNPTASKTPNKASTPAAKPTASKTPTYNDYYRQYYAGTNTAAYDRLIANYNRSVDQNTAQQIAQANTNAQGQLRQAYITRMQDQNRLNQNLATSGIRGGATETANLNLMNQYGNTRNTINSQLASSINSINQQAQQNKLAYQQDINAKRQQYIENRQSEARQAAREEVNNARNRAIAREETLYTRSQTKRTQDIEKYTAWASKYYDTKKLKAELEKAKKAGNILKQQIINARIGYLTSPEYKVANKNAK